VPCFNLISAIDGKSKISQFPSFEEFEDVRWLDISV
jgi:hypothetical protein